MIVVTDVYKDVMGRGAKITTKDEDTGKESEIVLSAEFCYYCVDDLAAEFSKFMKEKGHDITQGKI